MRLKQCEFPHSHRHCTMMSASSCGIWSFLLMVNPTKHNAGQLPLQQPLKCASVFIVGRPRGTYFCNLASMLSSFAAVMTFGCRPPVSHDLAANAAPATGRQPRLRSVSAPTSYVHMNTERRCFWKKKNTPGKWVQLWTFSFCQGRFSKVCVSGFRAEEACQKYSRVKW